jgi:hypothetical protein
MKSIFFSICLLLVINCAFGQQSDSLPSFTRADYLQKSKKQKTGAWLLVGAGGVILFGTLVSTGLASISNNAPSFPFVPVLLGSASIVGSISLFKASARNRRKAMDVSVELIMQRATPVQIAILGQKSFPGLSLKTKW